MACERGQIVIPDVWRQSERYQYINKNRCYGVSKLSRNKADGTYSESTGYIKVVGKRIWVWLISMECNLHSLKAREQRISHGL